MSFADELVKDGQAVVIRVDLSSDRFSTVSWRFTDKAYESIADPQPMARIVRVTPVMRALSEDCAPGNGHFSLTVASVDGALDGLMVWQTALLLRARLYVGLHSVDTLDEPVTEEDELTWMQLGEYRINDNPRRTADAISMSFEADILTGEAKRPPSIADWMAQDADCPFHWIDDGDPMFAIAPTMADAQASPMWTQRLPLHFGFEMLPVIIFPIGSSPVSGYGESDELRPVRLAGTYDGGALDEDYYNNKLCWPICASRAAIDESGDTQLWVKQQEPAYVNADNSSEDLEFPDPPDNVASFLVPRTVQIEMYRESGYVLTTPTIDVWSPQRSGPITIDGVDWYIHWVLVHERGLWHVMRHRAHGVEQDAGYYYTDGGGLAWGWRYTQKLLEQVMLKGAIAQSHINNADEWSQSAPAILKDLASYGFVPPLNADAKADCEAASGDETNGWSILGRLTIEAADEEGVGGGESHNMPPSDIEQVVIGLTQSTDVDTFIGWDGLLWTIPRVPYPVTDTFGLPGFGADDVAGLSDELPAREQRGAYYNRIIYEGVEKWESPANGKSGDEDEAATSLLGFTYPDKTLENQDNPDAEVTVQSRTLPRHLNGACVARHKLGDDAWGYRLVESKLRPRVHFTTGLKGLLLELGAYFTLEWNRPHDGPINYADLYAGDVFQVCALSVDLEACTVEVEAIWIREPL